MLFFCDDSEINMGQGVCDKLLMALKKEMADFGMSVAAQFEPLGIDLPHDGPPGTIERRTQEEGAIFAVWFSRRGPESHKLLTIHVFDPGGQQTLAKKMPVPVGSGEMDYVGTAFRMRSLMGASLYAGLDDILIEEDLLALAIPQERREVVEEAIAPSLKRRFWVRMTQSYLLSGYPSELHWYHGFSLDISLVPASRLEIVLDGVVAFPIVSIASPEEGVSLRFENMQFLLGLGVRYEFLQFGPVTILPAAGFRLGISKTTVTADIVREFLHLNPAIWAGVDIRISLSERITLAVGTRFENLFRYEGFEWHDTPVFELAQFRFATMAGVCVSL